MLEENLFAHNAGLSAGGALVIDDLGVLTTISGNGFTDNQGSASALLLGATTPTDIRVVGNLFEAPHGSLVIQCGSPMLISRRNNFVPFSTSALSSGCTLSP